MDEYVITGGREGSDRLAILARSDRPATSAFWDRIGVTAGWSCVDVGCGPGFVSLELAERVGSDGRVVGIDRDEAAIALARDRARAARLGNVEFVVGDVYDVSIDDGVDLAFSRLLLQHLSRPGLVLRAMWDAVRPGGVVAVEDADFEGGFCYPDNTGFEFWMERYPSLLRHTGGDPTMGRTLVRAFLTAGLPGPELDVVQRVDTSGEAKQLPFLTVEASAAAMIAHGIATQDEIDAALDSLRSFTADSTSLCGGPRHVQAWARKPGI